MHLVVLITGFIELNLLVSIRGGGAIGCTILACAPNIFIYNVGIVSKGIITGIVYTLKEECIVLIQELIVCLEIFLGERGINFSLVIENVGLQFRVDRSILSKPGLGIRTINPLRHNLYGRLIYMDRSIALGHQSF